MQVLCGVSEFLSLYYIWFHVGSYNPLGYACCLMSPSLVVSFVSHDLVLCEVWYVIGDVTLYSIGFSVILVQPFGSLYPSFRIPYTQQHKHKHISVQPLDKHYQANPHTVQATTHPCLPNNHIQASHLIYSLLCVMSLHDGPCILHPGARVNPHSLACVFPTVNLRQRRSAELYLG
jgi:hypothetical protein